LAERTGVFSVNGAKASANIYSLIENPKANQQEHLRHILQNYQK